MAVDFTFRHPKSALPIGLSFKQKMVTFGKMAEGIAVGFPMDGQRRRIGPGDVLSGVDQMLHQRRVTTFTGYHGLRAFLNSKHLLFDPNLWTREVRPGTTFDVMVNAHFNRHPGMKVHAVAHNVEGEQEAPIKCLEAELNGQYYTIWRD